MDPRKIFAKRLKQARQKAGLSMEALAKLMGNKVSKQTLSKYEAGKTMASSAVVCNIASALHVGVDYFFRPFTFDVADIEVSFRKKSSVKAKDELALKLKIQDEVERFLDIEKTLGIESNGLFIDVPQTISSTHQMIKLAKDLRREWNLGLSPIGSVHGMLMSHGIKVFRVDGPNGFDGISGKANDSVFLMVVNKNVDHTERCRFTHMRELAHLLANESFSDTLTQHEKERMCDAFASEMLLPSEVVEQVFGHKTRISFQELEKVQKTYGISIDAIVYSLKRLGILSDKRHRYFCMQKNMNPKLKADIEKSRYVEPETERNYDGDHYQVLVYSALAQDLISTSKAAQLLECSITEVESKQVAF